MRTPTFVYAILMLVLAGNCRAGAVPCLPGAEGFGANTVAGRGGRVIVVTNLRDRGPGSLRNALENAPGPRTVVFEVSGYIDLESPLVVRYPFVTVAGQTAPSPGITLRFHTLRVVTHDVLIQHLRVRVGGRRYRGQAPDGIQIGGGHRGDVYNVVIDHCSVTWAVDENIGFTAAGARNVTISNCIIAEGLRRSTHAKGGHSMGLLLQTGAERVAVIGNLFAHNDARNPQWGDGTSGVVVNNVLYNVKNVAALDPQPPSEPARLSIVGNHIVPGETTSLVATRAFAVIAQGTATGTQVYLHDNVCDGCTGRWEDDAVEHSRVEVAIEASEPPVWPDGFAAMPGSHTMDQVLANAGAIPWERDAVDARIIESVRSRSGGVIDCVEEGRLVLQNGSVASARRDALVLRRGPQSSSVNTAYRDYQIEIHRGPGRGEVRRITRYVADSLTCYVDPAWPAAPNAPADGSLFTIFQSCSLNAGGWIPLVENEHRLSWPDDHDRIGTSGYTRLEEWLHELGRVKP